MPAVNASEQVSSCRWINALQWPEAEPDPWQLQDSGGRTVQCDASVRTYVLSTVLRTLMHGDGDVPHQDEDAACACDPANN